MDEHENPIEDASIAIYSVISVSGDFDVIVQNLTDDVLTIDQTKSFFINPAKQSISYFDPTIRIHSKSTSTTSGSGKTFNLGGLANAFGIGGIAGSLLNATTIGKSNSTTNESVYTEVVANLPQVSIGPRGKMALSKTFKIDWSDSPTFINATPDASPVTFSVCITYSFDDGVTYDRIISDFYCNSKLYESVANRRTNDAVRKIIQNKPNATLEPWFMLYSNRSYHGIYNLSTFIKYQ